jgi:hypothetical protein
MKIRTAEASTQDIFVDINDLIIDLMMEAENADNESERKVYRRLIEKLTTLRNDQSTRNG